MLFFQQIELGLSTSSPPCLFTSNFRITERDRLLLQSISRFTLTTRLAAEICIANQLPFASSQTLYRRLDKLRTAGLIQRDRMLFNGEFYYFLSRRGASYLSETDGIIVPSRACAPVGLNVQAHEFMLSQFWIKFLSDSRKLQIPVLDFHRDGQCVFRIDGKRLIPDGTVILRIRGKSLLFFLEIDRSTQTSGIGGKGKAIIQQKLLSYRTLGRSLRQHPEFAGAHSSRVMFVCLTESRLENLRLIAHDIGHRKGVCFTCLPRYLQITSPHTAKGWSYRRTNLLAAPVFSFPIRPPPHSLLS